MVKFMDSFKIKKFKRMNLQEKSKKNDVQLVDFSDQNTPNPKKNENFKEILLSNYLIIKNQKNWMKNIFIFFAILFGEKDNVAIFAPL
jgi:hypothetical protein